MRWLALIVVAAILLFAYRRYRRKRKKWTILALDGAGRIQDTGEPDFPFKERDRAVERLKEKWPDAIPMELRTSFMGISERDKRTLNLLSKHSELRAVGEEESDTAWVMVVPNYYRSTAAKAMQNMINSSSALF